jgi:hypothetical protein
MSLNKDFNKNESHSNDEKTVPTVPSFVLYSEGMQVRSLTLVLTDGRHITLYYQYLMEGSYNSNESEIVLKFTTTTFLLKGSNLQTLFNAIMHYDVRTIHQIASRHVSVYDEDAAVVTEIQVGE